MSSDQPSNHIIDHSHNEFGNQIVDMEAQGQNIKVPQDGKDRSKSKKSSKKNTTSSSRSHQKKR